MRDPYEVLGVAPNATDDEIKKAYKELLKKYHPDNYAGTNNPLAHLAEEKYKEVQDAYDQITRMRSMGGGFNQGGFNQGQYNQNYGGYRQQYDNNSGNYGRPYGYDNGTGCGTGNICCDLWCADTLCECMGGDLCRCC